MSRVFNPVSLIFHGFPRVSGDEPWSDTVSPRRQPVFPA